MGGGGQEIENVLEVEKAEEQLDEFMVIGELEEEEVVLKALGKMSNQTRT